METNGRKKHIVTGTVSEVKKQEEALNIDSVGERGNNYFTKTVAPEEKKGFFRTLKAFFTKESK